MVRSDCGPLEAVTAAVTGWGSTDNACLLQLTSEGLNHSAIYLKSGQEKGASA